MGWCRHNLHWHANLLHVGGSLYNFVEGNWFVNPGTNPAWPTGVLSMRISLQGLDDVCAAIAASNADMDAFDGRNTQVNQIIPALRVVLQIIVRPLTTQREVVTCCYLLHHLLGPQ